MQLRSLLINERFSNFKLQKDRRILLCYYRYRIGMNDKIVDIVLLLLTFNIDSLLVLATLHGFALLETSWSANKNRVTCGTE